MSPVCVKGAERTGTCIWKNVLRSKRLSGPWEHPGYMPANRSQHPAIEFIRVLYMDIYVRRITLSGLRSGSWGTSQTYGEDCCACVTSCFNITDRRYIIADFKFRHWIVTRIYVDAR